MTAVDRQPAVDGRPLVVHPEVAAAGPEGRPVVALESTIIAHGLPRPENLTVARRVEEIVRRAGAVPATVGVVDGLVRVGLTGDELTEIAARDDVAKASVRDLPLVVATGGWAATTVAATAFLAASVGIEVFATGGLGGVHRGDHVDESADLRTLAHTGMVVVCSGVKSILDVRATLERLETYGVAVAGYGTDRMPGFYLADSGHTAPWRLDTPGEVARAHRAAQALGIVGALVVANPVPEDEQLDPTIHDRVLSAGLEDATRAGVQAADVTPYLLDRFHRDTGGDSLRVNTLLIERNARLAAQIAVALRA